MDLIFKEILKARVYDVSNRTPLEVAPKLSQLLNNEIFLKREDLQPIFSFKIRGAYNKIAHLSPEEKARGVLCASAGNHGQGVAYSAKHLGIEAKVVMPKTTPQIKVDAVIRHGATPILEGDSYSDAYEFARQESERLGCVMIHPFDDPLVIAGQGTIGKEIFEDQPDIDAIFIPIGGGGLIAGVANYLKVMNPHIRIVGVEPKDSNAMLQSVKASKIVNLSNVGIFADGVAVKRVGDHTFHEVQKHVDDIITVETDEICSAIQDIYEETRCIMEPAGALALAGLKQLVQTEKLSGQRLVAINSGANMNFQRLQFVAERALTGAKKEALFAIKLHEKPGTLKTLCHEILGHKGITEFNYRKGGQDEAFIFVGVAVSNQEDHAKFCSGLKEAGFWFEDLTHNELSKVHIRHMVGGRAHHIDHEKLISFQFPERPNALSEFLSLLCGRWNISLFHYRSHGSDFGKVLMGFEVEEGQESEFMKFVDSTGFPYHDESTNPAYQLFLAKVPQPSSCS